MGARFTYAAVYQAEAVCRTPLRTGGADGEADQVLRRRDGAAFVQGASLAGALREYLKEDAGLAEALFGSRERAGRLTVSDALFDRDAEQYTRPRLRINPVSATGQDGGKFDAAHMGAGSKLTFTLVWQGFPRQKGELDVVERLLGAMDAGLIRLGAQKSNGFGQLSLAVRRRLFDLTDPAGRRAWLDEDWEGEPLSLPAVEDARRVSFTVRGKADSLLVKGAPEVLKGGRSFTPNLSENGKSILPGSSVKGAVRARAEYIAKLLGLNQEMTDRYFGRGANKGEDNGLAGQVFFEDGVLSGQKKKISRIRIDRFTGGVQRQGLFTEEPLSVPLDLRVTAPEEPVLCALLVYALRDLGLGLYHLGSGWAIGRGRVDVERVEIAAPGGRRAALYFDRAGRIEADDPGGLLKGWLNALEEVRHEN